MQNIYVTSDTHFYHPNIVLGITKWRDEQGNIPIGSVRDFPTLESMNEALITNINNTVGRDDILYHLGDVAFCRKFKILDEVFNRINCKNKYLLLGNHDKPIKKNLLSLSNGFLYITERVYINHNGSIVYMEHHPPTNPDDLMDNEYFLYGHKHSKGENRFEYYRSMDVGVCGSETFSPYLLDDVLKEIDTRCTKVV